MPSPDSDSCSRTSQQEVESTFLHLNSNTGEVDRLSSDAFAVRNLHNRFIRDMSQKYGMFSNPSPADAFSEDVASNEPMPEPEPEIANESSATQLRRNTPSIRFTKGLMDSMISVSIDAERFKLAMERLCKEIPDALEIASSKDFMKSMESCIQKKPRRAIRVKQ